jgi:DNA modification methylase
MPRRDPSSNPVSVSAQPELVWPGKHDLFGRRRRSPARAHQLVCHERLPPGCAATRAGAANRLVLGDNLSLLRALTRELAGKVDLVTIDPPFATGGDFAHRAEIGGPRRSAEPARKVAAGGYRDGDWGPGNAGWFGMMAERLEAARELLAESGTLYVHVDWNAGHHLRVLLEEIFGADNCLGEIVWAYGSPSGGRTAGKKLVKAHDFILAFARSYGKQKYRPVYLPYAERYLEDWFRFHDADGRRYRKRWRRAKDGSSFHEKQYLDESKGVPASTVWTDIQQVYADPRAYKAGMRSEVTGYPTQKPLRLVERILALSSDPGDLVLDFFCGSGTALVAAERMGRRWIGCDTQAGAVQLAARRLLGLPATEPFEIQRVDGFEAPVLAAPPVVTLERRDSRVKVALSGSRRGWDERIERWSVGHVEGGALVTRWTAFRTLKERALPLKSPWLTVEGEPVAEVVDVSGASARLPAS